MPHRGSIDPVTGAFVPSARASLSWRRTLQFFTGGSSSSSPSPSVSAASGIGSPTTSTGTFPAMTEKERKKAKKNRVPPVPPMLSTPIPSTDPISLSRPATAVPSPTSSERPTYDRPSRPAPQAQTGPLPSPLGPSSTSSFGHTSASPFGSISASSFGPTPALASTLRSPLSDPARARVPPGVAKAARDRARDREATLAEPAPPAAAPTIAATAPSPAVPGRRAGDEFGERSLTAAAISDRPISTGQVSDRLDLLDRTNTSSTAVTVIGESASTASSTVTSSASASTVASAVSGCSTPSSRKQSSPSAVGSTPISIAITAASSAATSSLSTLTSTPSATAAAPPSTCTALVRKPTPTTLSPVASALQAKAQHHRHLIIAGAVKHKAGASPAGLSLVRSRSRLGLKAPPSAGSAGTGHSKSSSSSSGAAPGVYAAHASSRSFFRPRLYWPRDRDRTDTDTGKRSKNKKPASIRIPPPISIAEQIAAADLAEPEPVVKSRFARLLPAALSSTSGSTIAVASPPSSGSSGSSRSPGSIAIGSSAAAAAAAAAAANGGRHSSVRRALQDRLLGRTSTGRSGPDSDVLGLPEPAQPRLVSPSSASLVSTTSVSRPVGPMSVTGVGSSPAVSPLRLVHATAAKRIATLEYLRKAHEGRIYWLNTLLFTASDIQRLPYFAPARVARRASAFLLLGFSLPALLDVNGSSPAEYLRALAALLAEFDAFVDRHGEPTPANGSLSRGRMQQMFKRGIQVAKPRRASTADALWGGISLPFGATGDSGSSRGTPPSNLSGPHPGTAVNIGPSSGPFGATTGFPGPAPDEDVFPPQAPYHPHASAFDPSYPSALQSPTQESYAHLFVVPLPFAPDYYHAFGTLCDCLIDVYSRILELIPLHDSDGDSIMTGSVAPSIADQINSPGGDGGRPTTSSAASVSIPPPGSSSSGGPSSTSTGGPTITSAASADHAALIADLFAKADGRVKKLLVAAVVREFEDASRQGVRAEVKGVSRVVLGGLM